MDIKGHVRALSRSVQQTAPLPLRPSSIPRQRRTGRLLRHPDAPLRLNLGCGDQRLEGFVNIDMAPTPAADFVGDVGELPCGDGSVERIETHHFMEHIAHDDAPRYAAEWLRVLQPGGTLVIECADGAETVRRDWAREMRRMAALHGRRRMSAEEHPYRYTAERLTALLESVGFTGVRLEMPQDCEYFDEPCIRVTATK